MKFLCTKGIDREELDVFYQSKYDYYRVFIKGLIIVSTLAYFSFFATDCLLYNRFASETFLARFIVIIPFITYLIMHRKIRDYRIMVFASYLMIHIIIWCTDWATYMLVDRSFAVEGMIVMNLIFVCAGFCAPFWVSTIGHMLLIVDIMVAHQFIVYDNLPVMLLFNLPCIFAICSMHYIMQKGYIDQYITKKTLENLVLYDQLTGVYNRNKLKDISDAETEEFIFPRNVTIGVLISDIDFFKKVNDTYGHEIGDIILKSVAETMKKALRVSDIIIRWGGEEFVIIVHGCNETTLFELADRIRKAVESSDNGICPVTISMGATMYEGGSYHDCVEQADMALYRAKSTGRNKVVMYSEELLD